MANDPEIVAVELVGNLDKFDRTVKQSAQDFGGEMSKIQQAAQKAEDALDKFASSQTRHAQVVGRYKALLEGGRISQDQFNAAVLRSKANVDTAGAGYRRATVELDRFNKGSTASSVVSKRLGLQIGQIGSQLAVGTSPFIIMAQQASDVAIALDGTGGKLGKFIGFLGTMQGALILAAVTIGAQFIPKLFQAEGAVDDLVDKLIEQEKQTRLNKQADELFAKSLEGVEAAARTAKEAVEALRLVKKGEAEQTAESIKKNLDEAEALRATTRARIEDAKALYEIDKIRATRGGVQGEARALSLTGDLAKIEALENKLIRADAAAQSLRKSYNEAVSARTVAETNVTAEEAINRKYDLQIDRAAKAADASKKAQAALKAEIIKINEAREAELKRYRETEKAERSAGSATPTAFINPVGAGPISGKFGEQRTGRKHAGIDIAVPAGTGVKAAAGGTVIEAGNLPGYGNVVIIDHGGGTVTRYAHLSRISTSKGAIVSQGSQIGLSGGVPGSPGAGNSRGAHLHYEVRRNGKAVDPRTGSFPTDELGSQAKGIEAVRRAAEEELRRRQAFENELAKLQEDEISARQALITSAEEIAKLEVASIEISRAKYEDNLKSLVDQGKLTDDEAKELAKINEERAKLRTELVKRREDERKFRLQEAELRRDAQYASEQRADQGDLLQVQLDLARTQKERRDLEHRLLDLQFAEERARNDYLIAYAERLKTQEGIQESELAEAEAAAQIAELRNASLEARKEGAVAKSDRGTAGALEAYFQDIPSTADEINEALENVAAGGLATFTDALTDAIVNFRSLGDVGLAVLQNLTASLVRMAIQQIILKTIGQTAGTAAIAATGAQASAAAAAWAPAAALASLATLGANAGPAAAALVATNALASGLGAAGLARADGGPIYGPGGPKDDKVHVRASNGEYMIKASSARKLGRAALDRMNLTGELPYGYAMGGMIGFSGAANGTASSPGRSSGSATLDERSIGRLAQIVGDAARAMPDVKLFPTLDPAAALQASLATPGGQRAFFDFVANNSQRFKSAVNS